MKENKITMGDLTVCLEDLLRLGLIEEKINSDGKLMYKIYADTIQYVDEHPEVLRDSGD